MKIAIDARAYSWAGIGRYIQNILEQLARIPSPHHFLVLLSAEDVAAAKASSWYRQPNFNVILVEGSYYSWQEQTTFLYQLQSITADLFHFTHFNVPLLFSRPYVVTIHDSTRFIFPGQRHPTLFRQLTYEMVFKRAVERAQGVVCVSGTTRQDLASLPLRLPAVVETIYEGVDHFSLNITPRQRQVVRDLMATPDPYLLFVGVWMSHKNLRRLLQAFSLIQSRYPHLKLVITGQKQTGYVDIKDLVRVLGLGSQVIFPGKIAADLLPALYAEALALVFPSLYEGFGLPALEAAACGTPVVASNVSSLPEIMGSAAQYINPEDTFDIASGIVRILSDETRRKELIVAGREQAKKFKWRICGEQLLQLYERLG